MEIPLTSIVRDKTKVQIKYFLMHIFLNKQLFLFKRLANFDCWWH